VEDVGEGLRSREEYDYWISKCPIKWYADYLRERGLLDDALAESISEELDLMVGEAFEFAKSSPKPSPEDLYEHVYAD
jgi:pyruvate dehydrogenase E1 component alpha subunit